MCISFAKQCGEGLVNPLTPLRGLEPVPRSSLIVNRYYSFVNNFLQIVSPYRSFSTKWYVNNVYY